MNIKDLLNQMTIEEKLGQMTQLPPHMFIEASKTTVYGDMRDLELKKQEYLLAGSVLGIKDADEMISVQNIILKHSRLKIPALFMADIIHGYETIFPIPLAQAASFNPNLTKEMNAIAAVESSTAGIHVTFAPMVDLSRDARWGRVMEGYGEDPLLNEKMTKAAVDGYHHGNPKDVGYLASCFKHFAGYGASEAGRDYNTVDMSYERFYNVYQPSYQVAIDAGSEMCMLAFNTFNGIPATINRKLTQEILKKQMGFDGVIISDFDALHQTVAHGAARDDEHAAELGLHAGLMIEMGSSTYLTYGKKLLNDGKITLKQIDDAVYKILALKEHLGLFDDPYKGASKSREKTLVRSEKHLNAAVDLSLESPVLLKNNGVLPLNKMKKIALVGPFSKSQALLGAWHWHGQSSQNQTYAQTLSKDMTLVSVSESYDVSHIKDVDAVILTTGEGEYDSGESKSKVGIDIDLQASEAIKTLQKNNIPTIVLVHGGRPLNLTSITAADAIIYTWFLGSKHAEVITHILLGNVSPSGKLPMSLPRHVGQYPMSYHDFNTGRPFDPHNSEYTTKYLDIDLTPLYPFGYGLTYGEASVALITELKNHWDGSSPLTLIFQIENKSNFVIKEVLQIYMNMHPSIPVRPVKKLIHFKKQLLNPYEKVLVEFSISIHDLIIYDEDKNQHFDPSTLTLMYGFNSKDTKEIIIDWRPHHDIT